MKKNIIGIIIFILIAMTSAQAEYCRCSGSTKQYTSLFSTTYLLVGWTSFDTYECSTIKSEYAVIRERCIEECKEYVRANREEFREFLCEKRSDNFDTHKIKVFAYYDVCRDNYFYRGGLSNQVGRALVFKASCL